MTFPGLKKLAKELNFKKKNSFFYGFYKNAFVSFADGIGYKVLRLAFSYISEEDEKVIHSWKKKGYAKKIDITEENSIKIVSFFFSENILPFSTKKIKEIIDSLSTYFEEKYHDSTMITEEQAEVLLKRNIKKPFKTFVKKRVIATIVISFVELFALDCLFQIDNWKSYSIGNLKFEVPCRLFELPKMNNENLKMRKFTGTKKGVTYFYYNIDYSVSDVDMDILFCNMIDSIQSFMKFDNYDLDCEIYNDNEIFSYIDFTKNEKVRTGYGVIIRKGEKHFEVFFAIPKSREINQETFERIVDSIKVVD